jgi:hypothetical protein
MADIFHIFLSHSSKDTPAIRALVERWKSWDFRVFADIEDEQLKEAAAENRVDATVSEHLRKTIRNCLIFVFVASKKSMKSGWMPWELGLAHGAVGRVHVYQLDDVDLSKVRGREYLALYEDYRFDETTDERYLRDAVSRAQAEPANAAQLEAAIEMGRRALETLRQGRIDGAIKELSESPIEQARATLGGMNVPTASDTRAGPAWPWPYLWWWSLPGRK